MPRKKFTLAPDAAARTVDCACYSLNGGAPRCDALTHPWCLAPGESPLSCRFRIPPAQTIYVPRGNTKTNIIPEQKIEESRRQRKKPEAADHGKAD